VAVRLEIDDLDRQHQDTARVRLELVSTTGGKEPMERASAVAEFRGERQQRLLYVAGGPQGGILFRPEVKEWDAKLDLSAVHGPARLRARLLDEKNEPIKIIDKVKQLDPKAEKGTVDFIEQPIVLDDSAPEGVEFVNLPKRVYRGESFTIRALGDDPESGIAEVLFWYGRATPDGKPPADAFVTTGKQVSQKDKAWTASMPVASDETGSVTVTVQFTNRAGLRKSATARLPITDAPKPDDKDKVAKEKDKEKEKDKPKKKPSITGTVMEGDRPQEGIEVELRKGDAAAVIAKAKTDKNGQFVFKDLDPGSYRVSAAKSASMTRGGASVELKESEQKTGVGITLFR
jgi:hypothetical protein